MPAAVRRFAEIQPPFMTAEEFLAMPDDGSGTKYELVDGYLFAMAAATPVHNHLQARLTYLISGHLEARNSPCWVGTEPGVQPKMQADINVRVPDVGVSCTPLSLDDKVMRDPALLVEILSPSNEPSTRANVWLYASIPSVREILLVHSLRQKLELFKRQANGEWPARAEVALAGGAVTLSTIDMALAVDRLYRGTPLADDAMA